MIKVEVKKEVEKESSDDCSITIDEAWQLQLLEKEEDLPAELENLEDEPPSVEAAKLEEDESSPAVVVKLEEDESSLAPIEFVVLPESTLTLSTVFKTEHGLDEFQPSVTPPVSDEIFQHEHLDEPLVNQNRNHGSSKANPTKKKLPFECFLCKSSFMLQGSLNRHMAWHKKLSGKLYPCKHCKRRYRTEANFAVHLRKCNEERGPFICNYCGMSFQYSCALAKHKKSFHCKVCFLAFDSISLRTAHEEQEHRKKFPCTHCRKRFFTEEQLLDHMNAIQGISTHSCYFCGKQFLYKSRVLKHSKACLDRAFPCDTCEKTFASANELQDHRQKIHQLERLFGCNCCPEAFKSKEEHEVHLRRHTDLQAYYCDICIRWYLHKGIFEQHKTMAHRISFKRCITGDQKGTYMQHIAKIQKSLQELQKNQNFFPCSCCAECFSSNEKLLSHLISQHKGNNTHSCYFCGELFLHKSLVLRHLTNCIGKAFPCDECGERFATTVAVQEHRQNSHHLEKLFGCNFCPEAFKDKKEHEAHLKVHTDLKPYYCDICRKWFLYEGRYRHHESEVHKDLSKKGLKRDRFPCSHCDKCFSTRIRLSNHMNAHEKISSHSCYFCGTLFKYKSIVLKHLKKCTRKAFPCDQCKESFTVSSTLQNHRQKIHQSERLFECVACPKVFKDMTEHEVHLREHTDLQPLYCNMCNRWFLHKGSLNSHKRCHLS